MLIAIIITPQNQLAKGCNRNMSDSEYKLYYFPFMGRAEPIRILFAYKGIKYEDIRIPQEKWPEFKPKTPFGTMPILEEDGKQLGGNQVILRYLAEKAEFNVAGRFCQRLYN